MRTTRRKSSSATVSSGAMIPANYGRKPLHNDNRSTGLKVLNNAHTSHPNRYSSRRTNNEFVHFKVPIIAPFQPSSFESLLMQSFMLVNYIIVIPLFISAFKETDCLSIQKDFLPKQCDLNLNTKHELIEPMVVIDKVLAGEHNFQEKGSSFDNIDSMSSIPLQDKINCSNILKIHFLGYGERFVIDLIKNKRLISDRYFRISKDNINRHSRHPDTTNDKNSSDLVDNEFYKNHMFLNLHNFTTNEDHCHYHGFVNGNLGSISAISIVNHKLLSGFFHDGNDIFYLHANTTNSSTILTKSTDLCNLNYAKSFEISSVGFQNSNNTKSDLNATLAAERKLRLRRDTQKIDGSSGSSLDNFITHDPYMSNSSSLYVELLVVHDHSQYVEYKGNTTNVAERTMQIVNIMNAFYRQLNIFITLVGVVLWIEKDEIELTEDGDATLTNFLKYRHEKLLPKYHHDNAQLITSTSFNGSVVGKALKGPICTHEHSGGVNTAHSHSPAIVAVTLAHELGHNFGMEHDEEDKCKCPDEKCIMSSSSSAVHPKHWSSCSIDYLNDARKHGLLDCLKHKPDRVFGPICGNGFIEEGEDCDIGEPLPTFGSSKSRKGTPRCSRGQDCDSANLVNPCCDRQTCKFVTNATCAQGPCCDLSRCSVFNATDTKICRPRQSECDLEEMCDGRNEFCPPDVYYHDGLECGPTISSSSLPPLVGSTSYNRSKAYCYNGKCSSHLSQCQLLWGPEGSVSKDLCYEQNMNGNTSGSCGYNRREKTYESCEHEDTICGMLHCVHNQPNIDPRKAGKLGYGFESTSILTVSFYIMNSQQNIYCHGAIIDAGSNARDPGLVPNGAACGENKMCLDQKCLPVYDIVYKNWCPSDCNGNGICDNMGVCHCYDGTIGTSCFQFFGGHFTFSILIYMIVFFVPVIALIAFSTHHYRQQIKIWWFLHNRKIALRSRDKANPHHPRRIPHELNNRLNITISNPIPLNQQNNVNRPFYELPLDPWAETNCDSTGERMPGYRLEPIKKPSLSPMNSAHIGSTLSSNEQQSNLKPTRTAPPPPVPSHGPKV